MKKYLIRNGRSKVQPLTKEDALNMLILIKKKMIQQQNNNNDKSYKIYYRDWLIVKLGINTAFRITDLLNMKVDKNIIKGWIKIRESKTRKEQSFEINDSLLKDIKAYINEFGLSEGEYLFTSRQSYNKPITRNTVNKRIEIYANELKIKYPIGCHSLRKCFARCFYEQTGDIITLKEMLNHSSERVTLAYICWNEDKKMKSRKSFYI